MRAAIDAEAAASGKNKLLFTAAVAAGDFRIKKGYDIPVFNEYCYFKFWESIYFVIIPIDFIAVKFILIKLINCQSTQGSGPRFRDDVRFPWRVGEGDRSSRSVVPPA